jgi:hypothetical protein
MFNLNVWMVLNYDTLQNQFGTSQKTPKVTKERFSGLRF